MLTSRKIAYNVLRVTYLVSSIVCFLVAYAIARPPTQGRVGLFADLLRWLTGFKVFVVVATVAQGLLKELLASFKPLPSTWSAVKSGLDNIQKLLYGNKSNAPHTNRVTLFAYQRFHTHPISYLRSCRYYISRRQWPWEGWLIVVGRSGHTTQHTDAAWYAPDDAKKAEGIASLVWRNNFNVLVEDLPQIDATSPAALLSDYASKTVLSVETVQRRIKEGKHCARMYYGIPIEVNHKLWGVVIVDSENEHLPSRKQVEVYAPLIGQLIGNIIEGGTP